MDSLALTEAIREADPIGARVIMAHADHRQVCLAHLLMHATCELGLDEEFREWAGTVCDHRGEP
jgi:hypothetical protein